MILGSYSTITTNISPAGHCVLRVAWLPSALRDLRKTLPLHCYILLYRTFHQQPFQIADIRGVHLPITIVPSNGVPLQCASIDVKVWVTNVVRRLQTYQASNLYIERHDILTWTDDSMYYFSLTRIQTDADVLPAVPCAWSMQAKPEAITTPLA